MNGKTIEELEAENAELKAALAAKNLIPGVAEELAADVRRRVALGLSLPHAIQAAQSQAENDARVAAEEKAAAAAAKKKGAA